MIENQVCSHDSTLPNCDLTAVEPTTGLVEFGRSSHTEAGGKSSPKNIVTRGWTRTGVNFVLDVILLITFTGILGIAAIIRFVFPPLSSSSGWRLWSWPIEAWHNLLFNAIARSTFAVLLHVMLHWNWVCGVVSTKLSKWLGRTVRIDDASKTLWAVLLLMIIFAGVATLLAAGVLTIQRP